MTINEEAAEPDVFLYGQARWMIRFIATEVLRSILLLALMLLATGILVQLCFEEREFEFARFLHGLVDFVLTADRNIDGRPLAQQFGTALLHTAPLLAGAAAVLVTLSVIAGSLFVQRPGLVWLRYVILAASALPSFAIPFVCFLIMLSPTVQQVCGFEYRFRGIAADTSLWLPVVALAVGDLNLISVTNTYAESLQHELSQQHVRLVRALGRSVWIDVWPRSVVVLFEAVSARVPHLIGGTIALEFLFNIPGLGDLVFKAIVAPRPDYHVVLWVCGFGVVVSRLFHIVGGIGQALLLPESIEALQRPGLSELDDGEETVAGADAPLPERQQQAQPPVFPEFQTRIPEPEGVLPWRRWLARIKFYCRWNRVNALSLVVSCAIWAGSAVAILVLVNRMIVSDDTRVYEPNQSPTAAHWWGTSGVGEDVVDNLAWGLQQQSVPLFLALGICMAVVPAAVLGTVSRLAANAVVLKFGLGFAALLDTAMELIQAVPKLVILLACITVFRSEHLVLKIYFVMGLIYAPQLYRAVRAELAVLERQVFLEAMRTTGVPLRRVVMHNLLRNHCLHVVAVQSALLVASIIHLDALLGYVGIRNRGEIYTWGSILGTGIEDFLQLWPLVGRAFQFNDGVVWGPLLAVWFAIVVMFTLADTLKVPWSGYVYRLR